MTENQMLEILHETGALLNGHFELRSGLHSDRFFQCANLLRYPRRAEQLCAALVERMRNELGAALIDSADAVISPALGGILVGHEVARACNKLSIFAEKQDGRLVMRRFEISAGKSYIVAEDVVTRGGRVQETVELVEQAGGRVSCIGVLVDRSAGQAAFSSPMVSLLKMAPVTWPPAECPLCKKGSQPVHPGS